MTYLYVILGITTMAERKTTSVGITRTFLGWIDAQGKRGESYEAILKRLVGYVEPVKDEETEPVQ